VIGVHGWFYKVSGGGILAYQSECYAIYSPMGKMLWCFYGSYHKENNGLLNRETGALDMVLNQFGISGSEFDHPKANFYIRLPIEMQH
jgi:hypothetical protein